MKICKNCDELITEKNQMLIKRPKKNKVYIAGLCNVCTYRANAKRKNIGGTGVKCVNGRYWCKGCSEWLAEERFTKRNKSYCKDCQRIQSKCKKLGIEFKPKVDVYTLLIGGKDD